MVVLKQIHLEQKFYPKLNKQNILAVILSLSPYKIPCDIHNFTDLLSTTKL